MDNSQDQLLWRLFLEGNISAFEQIYRNHIHALYDFGMRSVSDNVNVQDSIQDLFLNLYVQRNRLSQVKNVRNYLIVRLRNILVDKFRHSNRLKLVDNWNMHETEYVQWRDTLEEQNETQDRESKLMQQIKLLTLNQQRVIYLRFVKGLSVHEIAEQLQINPQSVSNVIQRALKKLKSAKILLLFILLLK